MESKCGVVSKAFFMFLLLSLLLLGALGGALSGNATVVDSEPISVSGVLEKLQFGKVGSDALLGGTVVIDAAVGNKMVFGGAIDLGGRHSRAEFEVSGEQGRGFVITLPDEAELLPNVGRGPFNVKLTDFTSSPLGTGTIGQDGKATVFVGATLTLVGSELAAKYRSSFEIFVDYQP